MVKRSFLFVSVDVEKTHYMGEAVREMIHLRYLAEKVFGKKSAQALIEKLKCNSIYGKTGQGLHGNRERNILDDEMYDVQPSQITDGVLASTITAVVRQTLALIMNYIAENGYNVETVTTDGFVTNAPESFIPKIDEYLNDISMQYKRILNEVWGSDVKSVLEVKHKNKSGFFNIKTRGNIGVDSGSIFASAGYTGNDHYRTALTEDEKRGYLLYEVLHRRGRLKDTQNTMLSLHDLKHSTLKKLDKVFKSEEDKYKSISMDFDKKRYLLAPSASKRIDVVIADVRIKYDYPRFETRAFESLEEYEYYASIHKNFIDIGHNVKDLETYEAFELALQNGFPENPKFFKMKDKDISIQDVEEKKRAYTYYQIRQFFRVYHKHNSYLPNASLIKDYGRKDFIQAMMCIFYITKKSCEKIYDRERDASIYEVDLLTAKSVFDLLVRREHIKLYNE